MSRRLNYRLLIVALVIAVSATVEIAREYRPSFLRPDLRLYAYVGNSGDGTVSVIDLIRMANIATIPVGGAPSGLRANPALKQVWGVSTEGGYAFVIDAPTGHIAARIAVGASPFAVDFSQDGSRAFVAASGAGTVVRAPGGAQALRGLPRTANNSWCPIGMIPRCKFSMRQT